MSGFDSLFGIHATALKVRAQRAQVLADNLANAQTPGFKAKDIDFQAILNEKKASFSGSLGMSSTKSGHLNPGGDNFSLMISERQNQVASMDGNTVNSEEEKMRFAQNAVDYRTTLEFLNGTIRGYRKALKGE